MDDHKVKKIQFLKTRDWLVLIAVFLLLAGAVILIYYGVLGEAGAKESMEYKSGYIESETAITGEHSI